MKTLLEPAEVRVLGCLIEKELTTPDYYPLSRNAITLACNQKSNRDPVMDLSEVEVQEAVDSLIRKHLVWEKAGAGSRVQKYAHRLSGTLTRPHEFSRRELGVLAVLMLRGPQTPGEIRGRTGRMCDLGAVEAAEQTLRHLADRPDGPYVIELAREPGRRESRWAQLFGGPVVSVPAASERARPHEAVPDLLERISALEERMAALEAGLSALKRPPADDS